MFQLRLKPEINPPFDFIQVLDKTGMKGTGKWTIQESAEVSVAAPTISGSLNARFLSGIKDERVKASNILNGPGGIPYPDKKEVS